MLRTVSNIKKEIDLLEAVNFSDIVKDKEKTAFIVVDMVKGFYNLGVFASDRTEKVIQPIVKLNDSLNGCKKIFFVDSHTENSVEFKSYPKHCIKGTEEEEYISEIKADSNTVFIKKNSINGFHAPGFKEWLEKNKDIDTFIVTGVCTDICVETFVMTLKTYFNQVDEDKRIVVPMNTVETSDFGNHDAELMNVMTFFKLRSNGIDVVKEIV